MIQAEWRHVEELLESALRFEQSRRAAFLDQACAGDQGLRGEVESLLAYEERIEEFMPAPALDMLSAGITGEPERLEPRFGDGTLIGPYRILTLIGRGGMGEVYRANDTRLDRDAALKFLLAITAVPGMHWSGSGGRRGPFRR